MANQGYETFEYNYFQDRLDRKNKLKESNAILGIFDGPFLDECADTLASQNGFFTAHIMTSTSHSPWKIPQSFQAPLPSAIANAFNYVDASIKIFFEILGADPVKFNQILFVIVADHGSAYSNNVVEQIRIPLFFIVLRLKHITFVKNQRPMSASLISCQRYLLLLAASIGIAAWGKTSCKRDRTTG